MAFRLCQGRQIDKPIPFVLAPLISPGRLDRQIAETDAEIDNLVYDLYAITAEERKIIEGAAITQQAFGFFSYFGSFLRSATERANAFRRSPVLPPTEY